MHTLRRLLMLAERAVLVCVLVAVALGLLFDSIGDRLVPIFTGLLGTVTVWFFDEFNTMTGMMTVWLLLAAWFVLRLLVGRFALPVRIVRD